MPQDRTLAEIARCHVAGEVVVAPDVAIASGTVLQAAPGSRLVVEARVCIGAEAIIQAYGGELRLGTGVNVGPGSLLLGQGSIGDYACIGADSTLLNPQVAAAAVIPTRSLLGIAPGATVASNGSHHGSHADQSTQNGAAPLPNGKGMETAQPFITFDNGLATPGADPSPPEASSSTLEAAPGPEDAAASPSADAAGSSHALVPNTIVYGREQVTQLIATLFPHRRPLETPPDNGQSEP